MAKWYDLSLNWAEPQYPGPWRQSECDRFNAAAESVLADIRRELGEEFDVSGENWVTEDPDLDVYLSDPGFRR